MRSIRERKSSIGDCRAAIDATTGHRDHRDTPTAEVRGGLRVTGASPGATIAPMLAELLGLVVPPRCAACGRECAVREQLCEECESELTGLAPHWTAFPGLDASWSAAPYEGVARDLVAALKFRARLPLARRAGAVIAARAPADLMEGTIVPVPPAPARRRWRGFDAAEAIAAALSAETGLPMAPCLRRSQGRRQVGRPRSERLAAPPRVRLAGRPPAAAVLVDDAVTTGATLGACARALRSGGCGPVVALTFARS